LAANVGNKAGNFATIKTFYHSFSRLIKLVASVIIKKNHVPVGKLEALLEK